MTTQPTTNTERVLKVLRAARRAQTAAEIATRAGLEERQARGAIDKLRQRGHEIVCSAGVFVLRRGDRG
jgi:predicted ArsR family transcriptional regulator